MARSSRGEVGSKMGNELIKIDLSKTAREYFLNGMNSGKLLSTFLSSHYDFSKAGKIYTLITKEIMEKCRNIDHNFTSRLDIQYDPDFDLFDVIATMVSEHIEDDDNLCIYEDFFGSPGEQCLNELNVRHWTCENDIYFINSRYAKGRELIHETIGSVPFSYFFKLAFSSYGNIGDMWGRDIIRREELNIISQNTSKIILSAYDDDGIIVWEK